MIKQRTPFTLYLSTFRFTFIPAFGSTQKETSQALPLALPDWPLRYCNSHPRVIEHLFVG